MPISEASRAAGHVLLDSVSAYDENASDELNQAATDLAIARLQDTGAVWMEADGTVHLEDLVGVSIDLIYAALHAVAEVADTSGFDQAAVVSIFREKLDALARPNGF